MLDIIEHNGQPALQIDGAIIGTQEDIMEHLRKSAKCDILEEELFLHNGGVPNE